MLLRMVALLLSVGVVSAVVPPSVADAGEPRRGCVTRAEYRAVKYGMTRPQVRRLTGARPVAFEGHGGGFTLTYYTCDMHHAAFFTFGVPPRGDVPRVAEKRWTGAS